MNFKYQKIDLEEIITLLNKSFITSHLISVVILSLFVFSLRFLINRYISKSNLFAIETKRRLIVHTRNASTFIIVAGIFLIWGTELRSFAISAIAIAAAIVIATKELILCLSGAFVKGVSGSFKIGDRIEVNGIRGDVIDHSMFTTTLLEIGPGLETHQYTGRSIVLPNSLFVSTPIVNETLTDEYVLHSFSVPLSANQDWKSIEKELLEAAVEECSPYFKDAKNKLNKRSQKEGLEAPMVEPKVVIQIPEPGKLNLLLRIPTPARRKGRIEQAILRKIINSKLMNYGNNSDS